MKDRFFEFVPLRDVPLAVVYSTLWFIALWAFDFPESERIGVVIIAYVALWLSRLVVVNLTGLALRRLRCYARDVAHRLGVEIPDHALEDKNQRRGMALLVTLVLCAVIMVIFGLSLTLTGPLVAMVGLSTYSFYFDLVGWVTLGVGGVALTGFFASSLILFARAEALSNRMRTGVIQIEQSETAVSRLLRTQPQAA